MLSCAIQFSSLMQFALSIKSLQFLDVLKNHMRCKSLETAHENIDTVKSGKAIKL